MRIRRLKNLILKLKFNGFMRILTDLLNKIKICYIPGYLIEENLNAKFNSSLFPNVKARFLTKDDFKMIVKIKERDLKFSHYKNLLKENTKCFGLFQNDKVICFSFVHFDIFRTRFLPGKLKKDEAYLYDLYTLKKYRGKGYAPFLRYQLYQKLKKMRIKKIYSITQKYNRSSFKFKDKLKAKPIRSFLYINIFGLLEKTIFIKEI